MRRSPCRQLIVAGTRDLDASCFAPTPARYSTAKARQALHNGAAGHQLIEFARFLRVRKHR
jgi:hypothetical protein